MVKYLAGLFLIITDIISKKIAVFYLKDGATKEIIPSILRFSYVENSGAAFGIMKDMRWFFIVFTLIALLLIFYWAKKTKENKSKVLKWGLILLSSGAIGNFIDRIFLGYVVDFIEFYLISFPVFNMADIFVCLGMGLILIYYLFIEKEKENEQK